MTIAATPVALAAALGSGTARDATDVAAAGARGRATTIGTAARRAACRARVQHALGDESQQDALAPAAHCLACFGKREQPELSGEPGAKRLPKMSQGVPRRRRASLGRIENFLAPVKVNGVDGEARRHRLVEAEGDEAIADKTRDVVRLERHRSIRYGTRAPRFELALDLAHRVRTCGNARRTGRVGSPRRQAPLRAQRRPLIAGHSRSMAELPDAPARWAHRLESVRRRSLPRSR